MNIIDNDLLSMQEVRILVENAREAQKEVAEFPQEKLDSIVADILKEMEKYIEELVELFYEETEIGNKEDKILKLKILLKNLESSLRNTKYVGIIKEDLENGIVEVGVPIGVIAAFSLEANAISTLVYKAVLAIKSGNGIIFVLQNKAKRTMTKTLDYIIEIAKKGGLPQGTISYLSRCSFNGCRELINHPDISLILNTEVVEFLEEIKKSGKPLIYGGNGDSPVFIERTANISKAVRDIVNSKTFDNGVVPGSEQAVIVDKEILEEVKKEFIKNGAYFLKEDESEKLKKILFDREDNFDRNYIGRTPQFLAEKAGIKIEKNVKLLIVNEKYLTLDSVYSKEKLCPVIDFYIEDDWRNACEKCIELLLNQKQGHTLIIHSQDKKVIEQFILKKPVGRILVNTGGAFGSMGITTKLFPAMTLGSGVIGRGITSCNVSPENLIYIRKVGYETKDIKDIFKENELENKIKDILKQILK